MKLTEKCFKGMDGADAAMFTPICKDNRVNEEPRFRAGIEASGRARKLYDIESIDRMLGEEKP